MKSLQQPIKLACERLPDFKDLALSDQPVLEQILIRFPSRISGFTFAALYAWNATYQYKWTMCGPETLFISCQIPNDSARHFLQPVGCFEPETQDSFLQTIATLPYPAKIFGVSADFLQKNPAFVSHFEVQNDLALANYIYRAGDLATLAGKFYAKKRNLITQAHTLYQYSVHKLTPENRHECLPVLERVEAERGERDSATQDDRIAVKAAIDQFSALGQKGVLIRIEGKAAAFSIFEPLTQDMAVVHFEKADRHYKGLYQIINQETAKTITAAGFSLINREEDLGREGLRQAKLSYGPVEVIPSYTLVFKRPSDNHR